MYILLVCVCLSVLCFVIIYVHSFTLQGNKFTEIFCILKKNAYNIKSYTFGYTFHKIILQNDRYCYR